MPDPLPDPAAKQHGGDAAAEFATVQSSLATVGAELTAKGAAAGGEAQAVLEAASMMAQDPMLVDDVKARIDSGTTGERAVFEAFASFQEQLIAMGGYMAERATDLGDVSQRIIANLRGVPAPGVPQSDTPFILVARDLAPADTALLQLDKVLGLVTQDGGPTAHTAILARAKSLPPIVSVGGALDLADGTVIVLDAGAGTVTVDPSPEPIAAGRGDHRGACGRRPPRRSPTAPSRTARRCRCSPTSAPRRMPRPPSNSAPRASDSSAPSSCSSIRPPRPTVEDQTQQYTELLHALPRQEGRRAHPRCRRRQAARVPQRRARGEPGARAPRAAGDAREGVRS